MSGLNLLGGIGKGLMAGSQFIQQKNAQDMQLQQNQARLGMLQEDMEWQRQDRAAKQADKKRAEGALAVERKWANEDLADPEKFDAYTREMLPFASAEDLKNVRQQSATLRKAVGDQAVDRFLYGGDLGGFQDALSRYSPGAQLSADKGMLKITTPDGKTQDFADARGLATMLKIPGAIDRITAYEKARRDAQKDVAEISKTNATGLAALASAEASRASAGKHRAETEQVHLENTGLAALAPAERARSKSGNIPAAIQEAEWFRAATPEQKAAYERVKKISDDPRVASEAMRLLTADAQIMGGMTPETAVQKVQQTYDLASGRAPAKAPAAPNPGDPLGLFK